MDRRSLLQGLSLVFATAAATYAVSKPRRRRPNGTYVQMGTSITAGFHAPGSHLSPHIVGERLNLLPINAGFDGATAPTCNRQYFDDFCLERLVQAIHSRSWSAQDGSIGSMDPANRLSLSNLKSLAFDDVTYLGLEYGTNDFTLCVPLDVFRKSIRWSALTLLSDFTKIHIFIIGPEWSSEADKPNSAGLHLSEYADILSQVSHEIGIPYLDMMTRLLITPTNVSIFTADGKHPNEMGARVRGEIIASFIKGVFQLDLKPA